MIYSLLVLLCFIEFLLINAAPLAGAWMLAKKSYRRFLYPDSFCRMNISRFAAKFSMDMPGNTVECVSVNKENTLSAHTVSHPDELMMKMFTFLQ